MDQKSHAELATDLSTGFRDQKGHHVDDNDPDQENNSFIPNEFHLNIANAEVGGLLTTDLDAEKDQINEGDLSNYSSVRNMDRGGGYCSPQIQGGTKADGNVKNTQTGGGYYNPQIQGIKAGGNLTINMAPSEINFNWNVTKEYVQRREDDYKNRPVLCTSKLVGKTQDIKAIWECLNDEKIRIIGVYGMGGIGKTAIMKHIHNHLLKDGLFTIWVTVSKPLNLKKLQEDIAQSIKLKFSDKEDEEKRSTELSQALVRKKFVLFLDDMWERFSFEKVGIPEHTEVNGCKIVLTTRNLGVCRGMETQKDIQIMLLSEDEAWELFKEKVGGDEVLSSNLQDIAKLVAHECGRLPLAIITVGRALRKVIVVRVWKNALDEFRKSSNEIERMETDVYKPLRFSYDRLRNDTLRACFLYCALYPEDYEIPTEELIEQYWVGEGLIEERGNRDTELNKGHALLKELTDACMLESVLDHNGDECVKMHDLLRDMAISITRSNPHFVVKAGNKLEDPLKEDEWVEDVERISLMRCDIKSLPRQPNCPKLSTLFLGGNTYLRSVPSLFFHHMKALRVLDLSDTDIESLPESVAELVNLRLLDLSESGIGSLPESVAELVNLRVLNLFNTRIESLPESVAELENLRLLLLSCCGSLKKVPSLRKLNALRVLDLSYTPIEELPDGMEEMINLRRLDLTSTDELRTFQAGILSNLSSLEDLYMSELACELLAGSGELTSLTRIHIFFSDLSSFVTNVRSKKLAEPENFFFLIGYPDDDLPPRGREGRFVQINGSSPIIEEGSLLLPDKTQYLSFNRCNVSRLSKLPCLSNLKGLKELSIWNCDELELISEANDGATILSTLETMVLDELPILRALCSGVVSPPTLTNLKTLNVYECRRLRNLISFKLLQHLRNLEFVSVSRCKMMEEIIDAEDQDESKMILLKLKELELEYLPKLKRICRQSLICSSLEKIKVEKCPQLRKLLVSPLDNPTFAANGVIEGSAEWWGALEWDDPNTKTLLQPLFKEKKVDPLFEEEDSELEEEEDSELEEEEDQVLPEEHSVPERPGAAVTSPCSGQAYEDGRLSSNRCS